MVINPLETDKVLREKLFNPSDSISLKNSVGDMSVFNLNKHLLIYVYRIISIFLRYYYRTGYTERFFCRTYSSVIDI